MISKIFLKNFKVFGEHLQEIPLSKLTLIFGANSSGKSSIFQAILMLVQSIPDDEGFSTEWVTQGPNIQLGNLQEITFRQNTERAIDGTIFLESIQVYT